MANRRLHAGFVESLMKIYNSVQKDVNTRITEIAEIISDLRDPLISTQSQHMQQQPSPQQQPQQQREEEEEQPNQMDMTLDEMNEKEREEEMKRLQVEAKRNEEALRKKRVRHVRHFLKAVINCQQEVILPVSQIFKGVTKE